MAHSPSSRLRPVGAGVVSWSLLGLLVGASPSWATVPDLYGPGVQALGRGGGGVAFVADGTATVLNPAGLHGLRRPTLQLSFTTAHPSFTPPPPLWWDTNRDGVVDARDPPLELPANATPHHGFHLAMGRQIGDRFSLGLNVHVPTNMLFRLNTLEPDLPSYIRFTNRPMRYTMAIGLGGEVVPGLRIGASLDVVPKVRFSTALTADIAARPPESEDDDLGALIGDAVIDIHEIKLDIIPAVAPIVGVQLDFGRWWDPLDGLMLGASWRGRTGVPIDAELDVQANLRATDIGDLEPFIMAAVIDARLFLFDHFVPMRVDVGASYHYQPWVRVHADMRWTQWSAMLQPVARIRDATLQTPLFDLGDTIRDGNRHWVDVRDTVSVRSGVELVPLDKELANRFRYVRLHTALGGGYEPTPLVSQGRNSAFLDADRWWLSAGLGVETWDPLKLVDGALRFDLGVQLHRFVAAVLPRNSVEPRAGFTRDGSPLAIEGGVIVFGAGFGFEY